MLYNTSMKPFQIESLLSARLFLAPQLVDDRLYFVSDLSGRLSLYAMDRTGSVPEPLLPPSIALQNPHLIGGHAFDVLPSLGKIMISLDQNGDENYQPMLIPIEGGISEPLFGDRYANQQVRCVKSDPERNLAIFSIDPRTEPVSIAIRTDLATAESVELGRSIYANWPMAANEGMSKVVLGDMYTFGDQVLYLWQEEEKERKLLYGKPLEQREEGEAPPLTGFRGGVITPSNGLLITTALHDEKYGLGYLSLNEPDAVTPVQISGTAHNGIGELEGLTHLTGDRYTLTYNIDGCSWVYQGAFDETALTFNVTETICGTGVLGNGVLEHLDYDKRSGSFAASFSTATTPSQIYLIEPDAGPKLTIRPLTRERLLGIPHHLLAPGEDASYASHDGLRISARLYRPAADLGFDGPRPVVFYIHGGPQSQERPDFTWFSMPLIQFLTLNGIAVFVPNVRGSNGYGISYMKQVDRDWGGKDRLDHVAAFEHLRQDALLDLDRAAVVGRSYGGYMTLTLAGRHPDLWSAACDMFGPFNLFTFLERLPPTWRTYFEKAMGHPEADRDMLIERSPNTHLHQLACPLLVIQGANDPRVVEAESADLVTELRGQGKEIDYLVFDNEGHDVIKFENKVACYNRITEFFIEKLKP